MLPELLDRSRPPLPSGPAMPFRDVALLDLARHAAMQAALPLGSIAADTDTIFGALCAEADRLGHDDPRVRDAILSTAADTKKLVEQATAPGGGGGGGGFGGGVNASSGGLGGSGQHVGGGVSPGASLRDRGQAGRGAGPSALRSGQQKGNAAAIADELRKAGMPDEGIAAVLGSMQTESGFSPRAHNDVGGGHTGLWQWDARRWGNVRGWIESHGGDPWDVRWQAKAFLAEGQAKPGDAIYDNSNTSGGFRDIMGAKGNLGGAVHGVQRSERFGVGEEGGRAANASKWFGHLPEAAPPAPTAQAPLPAGTSPAAISDAAVFAARQRLRNGGNDPKDRALVEGYLRQQNAPKAPIVPPHGPVSFKVPPAGITPSVQMSYDQSRNRGDMNVTHNPVFNITGGDPRGNLETARMVADRGTKDLVRNLRAVEV